MVVSAALSVDACGLIGSKLMNDVSQIWKLPAVFELPARREEQT
ncbi:MAG: hypothetical protein QOJ66_639 [Ilumatobacteraceae bacterium]|jgi:hypothetical protein